MEEYAGAIGAALCREGVVEPFDKVPSAPIAV